MEATIKAAIGWREKGHGWKSITITLTRRYGSVIAKQVVEQAKLKSSR